MGSVFISYRRDDAAGHAGRLYDRLAQRFGRERVFMDVEAIDAGQDFVAVIEKTLDSVDAVVALIGRSWLTVADTGGRRRLDDPQDLVRLELATALRRQVVVVPTLVGGARLPSASELPEDLRPLVRRNALEVSDSRFDYDADRLADAIQRAVGGSPVERKPPVSTRRRWMWPAGAAAVLVAAVALAFPYFAPGPPSEPDSAPIPTPSGPRTRVSVAEYAGAVSPEARNQLGQFLGIMEQKINQVARELEEKGSQLAAGGPNPLAYAARIAVDNVGTTVGGSIEGKRRLWSDRHALTLFTGTLFPGNPSEVRSNAFVGGVGAGGGAGDPLDVQLVLRLQAEEVERIQDSHSLAVLYALALDARAQGQPPFVLAAILAVADETLRGAQGPEIDGLRTRFAELAQALERSAGGATHE